MKDIYVIYWSGTGNTQAMAQAVAGGIDKAGAHGVVLEVGAASPEMIAGADSFALGCPAMGSEELEEGEMEPFVSSIEGILSGKRGAGSMRKAGRRTGWVEKQRPFGPGVIRAVGCLRPGRPDTTRFSSEPHLRPWRRF